MPAEFTDENGQRFVFNQVTGNFEPAVEEQAQPAPEDTTDTVSESVTEGEGQNSTEAEPAAPVADPPLASPVSGSQLRDLADWLEAQ